MYDVLIQHGKYLKMFGILIGSTLYGKQESLNACLNGKKHDFKNIMELPNHVNVSKRFFQT